MVQVQLNSLSVKILKNLLTTNKSTLKYQMTSIIKERYINMQRLLFNTKIGYPTGDQLYHKFIVFIEINEYDNIVAQIRFDQSNLDQFYDATEDFINDLDDDQEVQDKVIDFFEQFDVESYLIEELNAFGIKKGINQESLNKIVRREGQLEHYN